MALGWSRHDFLTDWAGLFSRRQSVDVPRAYASVARNIDFFGSAIGKRLGTQLVNGWGTLANAGWVNSPNGIGTVVDSTGFQATDTIQWRNPDTTSGQSVIAAVTYGSNTVQLTAAPANLPQAGAIIWVVRTAIPNLKRLDGLFHAVFRDGTEYLVAASPTALMTPSEVLYNIWGTAVNGGVSWVPAPLVLDYNAITTTISANWGSTTTGPVTAYETLVGADGSTEAGGAGTVTDPPTLIQIIHGATVIYEGTIQTVTAMTSITLSAAALVTPVAGDTVILFPHRTAGDTRFAQGANVTHITSAAGVNPIAGSSAANPNVGGVANQPPVQRTPPVKLITTGHVQRHGIKPPQFHSLPFSGGVGTITTTNATYRHKFRNSLTEQESEPGPISATVSATNQNISVPTVQGSPDPQVDKIRFYRSLSGTAGAWYFAGEVANPGSGGLVTFVDTTPDAGLGPLMREFLDLTIPDTCTHLVYWPQAARLVGIDAVNQFVILSDGPEVGIDPVVTSSRGRLRLESFPADNILFVNRDDGDKLVALAAFFDAVLIFKGHSVWRLIGTPPDIVVQPVLFRDDLSGVGAFSPKSIAVDQDAMVFAGEDGFYSVTRTEGIATGFASERLSRAIDDEWAPRLVQNQTAKTHIVYARLRRQLRAFACVDANPTNEPNEMFVYQYDGTVAGDPHGWAEWSPPALFTNQGDANPAKDTTCSAVVRQAQGFATAYYGTAQGYVLKSDQPLGNDAGNSFPVEYETVWFAPQGGGGNARGRALDTIWQVDQAPVGGVVPTFQLATDFGSAATTTVAIPATGVPQTERGIVFLLGEYHRLGFKEQDPSSRYRLLDFTYLFQALPLTVADRSAFVQAL
jgi:hypothetical protein